MRKTVSAAVPRIRAKTPIGILKAVVKIIRAEPLRYNQGWWAATVSNGSVEADDAPPCGTVCCVAGWVAVSTRSKTETSDDDFSQRANTDFRFKIRPRERAQDVLGLTNEQAYNLFDGGAVKGRPGTKRYVEAGVRHIEKFMRDELGYTGPKL